MPSIHERVASARRRLVAAGIDDDEATLDARLLAQCVLGWDAARFLTSANEPEPAGFAAGYLTLVERRERREPMAYIVGHQEFWGLQFEVTRAVLIPRPETELIVETALTLVPPPSSITDVCTGSGCIAIALATEYPDARLVATDLSSSALTVARRNARRHGVDERISFVHTDLLQGVAGGTDLVVANPPYVEARARETLPPEVREHEPASALFGGADGLDVIRRLIVQATRCLRPGGTLLFEFGAGQAHAVSELISASPDLTMVQLKPDLQGIPRVAVAHA